MENKNIKDVPVTAMLAVCIVVIFSLYTTLAIKNIPCGKDMLSVFYGNFVHVDSTHLVVNLYSMYALSRVEQSIGGKSFVALIVFLLFFNTIVEVAIHNAIPTMPCSIGFSGVLFGIITWELVTQKKFDFYLVTSIIAMVALPSIKNNNVSLSGHAVGAFSGIIGGLIWNKLAPVLKLR
jgi:membrane associated rhomboid family serine protease